jgi:hypothetical protein
MEHNVDVGAAIVDIDDAMPADRTLLPQVVEYCDLAISGAQAFNVGDFALVIVGKPAREDVLRRNDAFQGRFNDLLWTRGDEGAKLWPSSLPRS